MPVVEFADDGNAATGKQHFIFVDQQTHAMRLGWYNDEYVRTPDGWRIHRRSTTFMRKSGAFDSGIQHDPLAEAEEGVRCPIFPRSSESTTMWSSSRTSG